MGKYFFDKYSLLHFAWGVIARYLNIRLYDWLALNIVFEIVENTSYGMNVINRYFWFWPGGKPERDSLLNNIGDIIFALLGYMVSNLALSMKNI